MYIPMYIIYVCVNNRYMHIAVWAWCPAFQSMASYGSMYGELVQANFAKKNTEQSALRL